MTGLYKRILQRKLLAWMVVLITLFPTLAVSQYFGQNKVQYKNFKFKILKTEHFDVYYYPEEAGSVTTAARMAERWYARHARLLGYHLRGRQPIILYASHPDFEQTNAISGALGSGTGGVTEPLKRRIVLPFAGPLAETDHVIGHELVHAFQFDMTGQRGGEKAFRLPGASRLPLWFIEGMAEFLSIGPEDAHTAMWMRDAVKYKKKLPTLAQLVNSNKYFPYRYGQAALAFIAGKWGDDKIGEILQNAGKNGNLEAAIKKSLGVSADTVSIMWHQALHQAYDPLTGVTKEPEAYGSLLLSKKHSGGRINVGPVLSPDGKNLIFFSEKNLFAIDIFLADAKTGRVKKTVVHAEMDPHFGNLEFINAAGAWHPDGKKFVFPTIVKATPNLMIMDVERGKVIRKLKFPGLGEVFSTTWSPDGRFIVFTALEGGFSNLYQYDLQTDQLQKLTDDPYAELQPAFSPDGQKIAFVTDRFSTSLENLNAGNYRLAVYRVSSGSISPLPSFASGKNINPQWSPDGRDIYFVSDQTGISNIYRLNLESREIYQLTNLYSGVSGITALSPVISVANQTGELVYCAFQNEKYNIYRIDPLDKLAGLPVTEVQWSFVQSVAFNVKMLPPVKQNGGQLLAQLHNPDFGLPSVGYRYKVVPYRPRLSLDFIGQPTLFAGMDRFGAQLGGGISMYWSDMLGNHNLATMLQVQSQDKVTDLSAYLGYLNTSHRLNWGATIQQTPYIYSQFANGYATLDSNAVYEELEYRFRQINRSFAGYLAYPFSQQQRVEVYSGFSRISFDQRIITRAYDYFSGKQIYDRSEKMPSVSSLNFFNSSVALVYDNSFFGATSPLLGQRYRFELSNISGTLSYRTLLADYRRYIIPVKPFTLAFRFLHYGRYGAGSEDPRLSPLFIGYRGLIRGYESRSFSASECQDTLDGQCAVFDRLLGSRIAITNMELRFPLLGLFGVGSGYFGYFPVETGVFYDAGVAWSGGQKLWFLDGGTRKLVRSYGAVIRVNLLGYAVLEINRVKPLDRPKKSWLWQINFNAGF